MRTGIRVHVEADTKFRDSMANRPHTIQLQIDSDRQDMCIFMSPAKAYEMMLFLRDQLMQLQGAEKPREVVADVKDPSPIRHEVDAPIPF